VKEGAIQTLLNHIRTLEDRIGKLQARVETLAVAATLNSHKGTPDNKDKMNINNLHQVETNNPPIQPIVNFSRNVVKVKCGDLFESPSNETIVHCVAKDFKMSDGIACIIKHKYCIDPVPLAQEANVGDAVFQNVGNYRNVIHLVTKDNTYSDPTWKNFRAALINLPNICEANNVTSIHMPKIGTGLDKLHWPKVMRLLNSIFAKRNISVTVWYLNNKREKQYRDNMSNKRMKAAKIGKPPKIYVLGDSHTKDLAPLLHNLSDKKNKVFAHCIPGGTSEHITKNLNQHVSHLDPEDTLVYYSGTNDFYKSDGKIIMSPNSESNDLVLSHSLHTNVIIVSVPLRNKSEDPINEHINKHNESLLKTVTRFKDNTEFPERVQYLDVNEIVQPHMYKPDELHLNAEGKLSVAMKILEMQNNNCNVNQPFRE